MQFLKTLFWVLVAVIAGAFAFNNWMPISIRLWGGLIADINLPLLLLIAFLIGYLPMLLIHHASRWRLKQRVSTLERSLAELSAMHAPPPPAEPLDPGVEPETSPTPTPPQLP